MRTRPETTTGSGAALTAAAADRQSRGGKSTFAGVFPPAGFTGEDLAGLLNAAMRAAMEANAGTGASSGITTGAATTVAAVRCGIETRAGLDGTTAGSVIVVDVTLGFGC